MKKIFIILVSVFLASCSTPIIHLKSSGMSMDLKQSAWDVRSVAVSPDGKYALSGSQNGYIRIWDVSTGRVIKTINAISGPFSALYAIALSPDNKYVLTGGDSGVVKLWDVESEKEARVFEDHSFVGGILSVGFSPDGKQAFGTGGMTKAVRRWDISTGKGSVK